MKIYEYIKQLYDEGLRDASYIQEATREKFPHKIVGRTYVLSILRQQRRPKCQSKD